MIERKYFGETQNGDIVSKFLLENKSGMQVEVSDLGALILAISIIDKFTLVVRSDNFFRFF